MHRLKGGTYSFSCSGPRRRHQLVLLSCGHPKRSTKVNSLLLALFGVLLPDGHYIGTQNKTQWLCELEVGQAPKVRDLKVTFKMNLRIKNFFEACSTKPPLDTCTRRAAKRASDLGAGTRGQSVRATATLVDWVVSSHVPG